MRFPGDWMFGICSWICVTLFLCLFPVRLFAQAQAAPDPFAGDVRFAEKRTVEARGLFLPDLLARLSRETGVPLKADRSVENDRVILFAHDRHLSDILRTLANFFGFEWRKEGEGKSAVYTLYQTEVALAEERKEIEARYERSADLIMVEIAQYKRLEGMMQGDREALYRDLQERMRTEKEPAKREATQRELSVVGMAIQSPGHFLAARFLEQAGRPKLIEWLHGTWSEYGWPEAGAGENLAPEFAGETLRFVKRQPGGNGRDFQRAKVQINGAPGLFPLLNVSLKAEGQNYGSSHGAGFPQQPFEFYERPPKDVGPADWRLTPRFQLPVDLSIPLQLDPRQMPTLSQWLKLPRLVEAVTKLEEGQPIEQPLDLISDTFRSMPLSVPASLKFQGQTLGEALTGLCAAFRHRWSVQAGFVVLRSRDFAALRARQLPVGLYRRLTDPNIEMPELEEYAALFALPEEAYQEASQMISSFTSFASEMMLLSTKRGDLILWSLLTPEQRTQAQEKGLGYKELSSEARKIVRENVKHKHNSLIGSNLKDNDWTSMDLDTLTLQIKIKNQDGWGYRMQRGTSTQSGGDSAPRTRQEAYALFLKSLPDLRADEMWSIRSRSLEFHYAPSGKEEIVHLVSLPGIWKPADKADKTDIAKPIDTTKGQR